MELCRKTILLLIFSSFITLGFSQVSLEIKNIYLDEGTLDIYMSNTAACSYCTDPIYNYNSEYWFDQKGDCETWGDATWVSYEQITEFECSEIPSYDGNGGWWFDGEVAGFQFEIVDPAIYEATGSFENGIGYYTIIDASGEKQQVFL